MPKMNLYLGSLSDYCHALVYKAAARNVKRPDVSPRNRSYPHSKVTLRVRETQLRIVEKTDARDSFTVRSHRDMLLCLVASAFFLRAVTTINDVVAELSGEHAVSIPKTATSLPIRSGFIYSGSFLVTRLHSR